MKRNGGCCAPPFVGASLNEKTYLNDVPATPIPEVEVLAVQSGATTRLTTDPFFNTSCCSSVHVRYVGYQQRSHDRAQRQTRRKWVTQHRCQIVLDGLDSLRTFQGALRVFAGLPLYPRVCSLTTGIEECRGRLDVQTKGGVEISCEFGPRCARVEALNGTAVWDGRAERETGDNRTSASDIVVIVLVTRDLRSR